MNKNAGLFVFCVFKNRVKFVMNEHKSKAETRSASAHTWSFIELACGAKPRCQVVVDDDYDQVDDVL